MLILMMLMGAQVALKPPLCIDSRLVNKIDSFENEKSEMIFSCRQFKLVPFSDFFYRNLPEIERQLSSAESALAMLKTGGPVRPVEIALTSDELEKKGLERRVLKTQLMRFAGDSDSSYINILTDFLLSRPADTYGNFIGQAWAKAFEQQNLIEKLRILESVRDKAARPPMGANTVDRLKWLGAGHVRFMKQFEKNLRIKLDIVIESEQKLNNEELSELARRFPERQIGVQNRSGLYLLPAWTQVDSSLEPGIKTFHRIVIGNHGRKHSLLKLYEENSESIVMFSPETRAASLNYRPLFQSGVAEFLALNRGAEFVQLHLPSLRLKETSLLKIGSFFDFVRHRKSYRTEYRALGWEATKWNSDIHAFKPVATYDVIQMYRVN